MKIPAREVQEGDTIKLSNKNYMVRAVATSKKYTGTTFLLSRPEEWGTAVKSYTVNPDKEIHVSRRSASKKAAEASSSVS